MKIIYIVVFTTVIIISSCKNSSNSDKFITSAKDYNYFLNIKNNEVLQATRDDYRFWEKKYEKESNQHPYLVKAAASQSKLFNQTGCIDNLIRAEKILVEANQAINYSNSSYLRSLASNYISQHRFKEALSLLQKAESIGDKRKASEKMLFDVHLELGNIKEAKAYLAKIENYKDFDFLIRLSKWSDYNGDLDKAIFYLRKATEIAESSKNKALMLWAYTNLADFYGHAGKIEASYHHYIKALKLNPNDAYAKKGIAWIVYSYEKNPDEALRILNAIGKTYNAPDNYLLKAEIAEFKGDINLRNEQLALYQKSINNKLYGDMYNKYSALLYAENKKQTASALKIAFNEIDSRPTPQSYDLLAWTYYNHGDIKEALKIMEDYVAGKTFEPEILFHLATIYKANGKQEEADNLKKELEKSTFELGPLMTQNFFKI